MAKAKQRPKAKAKLKSKAKPVKKQKPVANKKPAAKKKPVARKPAAKPPKPISPAAQQIVPLIPQPSRLAELAIAGNTNMLLGLMNHVPEDDRDATAYKWLAVASDFGHEDADELIGDLLEGTSLRFDDDQFVTGHAHWELGLAYLTATDGLPRDLDKARGQLVSALERGYPMSVQESDTMLAHARARLAPDSLAVFDAVYDGASRGRLDDRADEGAEAEGDDG